MVDKTEKTEKLLWEILEKLKKDSEVPPEWLDEPTEI